MARWSGKIGFVEEKETSVNSGIFKSVPTEKPHYGTIVRESKKFQGGYAVNDNAVVTNRISFVGTQYAIDNVHNIKYAEFNGRMVQIKSYNIERPRIVVTLGGVWNGVTARITSTT